MCTHPHTHTHTHTHAATKTTYHQDMSSGHSRDCPDTLLGVERQPRPRPHHQTFPHSMELGTKKHHRYSITMSPDLPTIQFTLQCARTEGEGLVHFSMQLMSTASTPSLPTIQFMIAYSMQILEGEGVVCFIMSITSMSCVNRQRERTCPDQRKAFYSHVLHSEQQMIRFPLANVQDSST